MIRGVAWLLLCQAFGEVAVRVLNLPVPGPVVGMVLLFVLLQWRRPDPDSSVLRASDGLLRHLQLLFVPAGAGVVAYAAVLRADAVPVAVGLLGSWLLGFLVVGWLVSVLTREHA